MCLRLQPASTQPDAGHLGVRPARRQQSWRGRLVQSWLLEDEAVHRPDLLLAVFVAWRIRIVVVGVMLRVR